VKVLRPDSIIGEECEVSVRTTNCLANAGLNTWREVADKHALDLLRTPNFGKRSLKEVREILAVLGLSLRGETIGATCSHAEALEAVVKELRAQANKLSRLAIELRASEIHRAREPAT
jgi:hypothetical protein